MVVEELQPDQQVHGIGQQPMHPELLQSVSGVVFHSFVVESVPNGVQKVVQLELLS